MGSRLWLATLAFVAALVIAALTLNSCRGDETDKVVLRLDTGTSTAVDLEADAAETGNSGPADRERADRLLADLQAQRHRLDAPPKSRPAEKIDPETGAALRALGYIE
jgi:phytoene dehydrogenase-like protein